MASAGTFRHVPPDPRGAALAAVRRLLVELGGGLAEPVRVADRVNGLACLLLVWDPAGPMPTIDGERRRGERRGRAGCRADVLAVIDRAGRPLTRKEVTTAVRAAGHRHGASTVAKALADLTAAGELVNSRDGQGYRLPGWVRPRPPVPVQPGLFGDGRADPAEPSG